MQRDGDTAGRDVDPLDQQRRMRAARPEELVPDRLERPESIDDLALFDDGSSAAPFSRRMAVMVRATISGDARKASDLRHKPVDLTSGEFRPPGARLVSPLGSPCSPGAPLRA